MKTNDQYKRVTRGSCAGGMEQQIQDEIDNTMDEIPERTSDTTGGGYVEDGIFAGMPILRKLV